MILNPSNNSKHVCNSFPKFQLARSDLSFVAQYTPWVKKKVPP